MSADAVTTLGRYRLIRELGRGGEATVHLAEDLALKRVVALKIFPPSIGVESPGPPAGYLNEVEVLSRLDHPGICTIHDAGIEDGCAFIAMSYVEGRTLADGNGMEVGEAVRIAAEVADTLTAAHQVGIVHGDLKPANILLTRDGRPVLLDFGVAGFLDGASRNRPGRIAGTLSYLAPERLASAPDVAADVFGLGAVLFELVAGTTPFSAPTEAALIGRIERDQPPLLRALVPRASPDLEAVLAKAVDRSPSARYPAMTAFAADLRKLAAGERVSARRYGPVARAARWARRRKALAALLVFAAAFLVVATAVTIVKSSDLEGRLEQAGVQARRATAARAAEDSLVRHERLADRRRLQDLEARAARLVPPAAAIAPALQEWLNEARVLVGRLDEHRRALADVRTRGRPAPETAPPSQPGYLVRDLASLRSRLDALDDAAPARPRLASLVEKIEASLPAPGSQATYANPADSDHEETLGALIEDLERFADPDRFRGTVADVAHRLDEIRTIDGAAAKNAALWEVAVSSIANEAECPRYRGLRVKPQAGLIPLRRDPASGLWEFLHVLTGDPPRVYDGRCVIEPGTGIVLVLVPGGVTRMGARRPREGEPAETPHVDAFAGVAEGPVDAIPLDPCFVSKFEMTEAQWIRIRAALGPPDRRPPGLHPSSPGTTLPVLAVNWFEARSALARVGLDLPTEAQWEHAARAGTTTPWPTGLDPSALATMAAFGKSSAEPVGRRQPNAFGIHDLFGNAAEWCLDVFARYDDPRLEGTGERFGLDETEHRILRGGSTCSIAGYLRSASRDLGVPASRMTEVGVRPSRRLDR